jgi:hypothetical protein
MLLFLTDGLLQMFRRHNNAMIHLSEVLVKELIKEVVFRQSPAMWAIFPTNQCIMRRLMICTGPNSCGLPF